MKRNALTRTLLAAGMLLTLPGQAETINLQQAVAMSLAADPVSYTHLTLQTNREV